MNEDLVERIQSRLNDAPLPTERLLDEASEEIKRLRAENDRLRDLLRRARDSRASDYVGGGWTEAVDEVLKP